jgi:protein SHQ1
MSGFLTPHFSLSQDSDFVRVCIRLPHLRATSEGEFYIDDCQFKFFLKPYFLRLTFWQSLTEDGRERAQHDIDSGILTVWLPKAVPGQQFQGLDMLTELLRKPEPKPRGPLIEVLGSDGGDRVEDGEHMSEDDFDIEAEQQFPSRENGMLGGGGGGYGFNGAFSGVFAGLEDEALVLLQHPESTDPEGRRRSRLTSEDAAFSSDHYMADYMDDQLAQEAIAFMPWWESAEAQVWRDAEIAEEAPSNAIRVASGVGERPRDATPSTALSGSVSAPDSVIGRDTHTSQTARAPAPFALGGEYQEVLLSLPRKEFLLSHEARRCVMCGLVDLLFAYAYDVRTTHGETTVESGWTIRRLSSLLSFLESFDSLRDVAVACTRRSLCHPLVRHLKLSRAVLNDVCALLRLGRPAVLRSLLDVRTAVQSGGDHGYLLNRIWVDDYCVWVQQMGSRSLPYLAEKLSAVSVAENELGWPLSAYEELAREEEGGEEEDDSCGSSSSLGDEDGGGGGGSAGASGSGGDAVLRSVPHGDAMDSSGAAVGGTQGEEGMLV